MQKYDVVNYMSKQDLTSWCRQLLQPKYMVARYLKQPSYVLLPHSYYNLINCQQACHNLGTTCDKVGTCLAFLYGTVCSRFDQDGYRVPSRLEALLCDHEAYLGDFDNILIVCRIDLDQDHQAIVLHVLHSYIHREVEKKLGEIKVLIA